MAENETVEVKLTLIDEMSNEIKAIRSNMETNFNAANKKLAESKGAFANLGSEIKGSFVNAIKGAVLAYASFEVINKVTGFLKDARMEYKEAVQMQAQLRTSLGFTSKALNDQADALGKKLIVDNEEITAVQIKLANYIKSEDQIKKLTPAVLDLAAATGMDMASAANMVARAIADDGDELGRFKIAIEGAKGSSERAMSAFDGITKIMGGQAEAVAKTKDVFDEYSVGLKQIKEDVWPKIVFGASVVHRTFSDLGRLIAGTDFKTIQADSKKYFDELKNGAKEVDKIKPVVASGPTQEERDKRRKEQQDLEKQQAEDSITAYTMVKESEIALMKDGLEKEFALLNYKYEVEQQKYADNKIILAALEQQYNNQAQLLIQADNQKDFENQQKKLEAEKTRAQNILYIDTVMQDELNRSSEESFKAWVKQEKQKAEMEKQQKQQAVSFALGTAASIFAGQKKYIALYKTFAISQALMDTYAAANTALKGAPPPFNFIMAGATVAAGLLNVQKIAAQKFATGTAFAPGGLSLINEQGGEYVNLPRGAQVFNNTQTRNMTTSTALTVNITDSSGNITETVRAQLRSGQGDQLVRDLQAKMARLL